MIWRCVFRNRSDHTPGLLRRHLSSYSTSACLSSRFCCLALQCGNIGSVHDTEKDHGIFLETSLRDTDV